MKNKKELDKLTEDELRAYLNTLTIDKIPKGNSRFRCKKHNKILSYGDVVSGCFFCIMKKADEELYNDSCKEEAGK